jgi:type IV secretion/conjugal transfer VirB4 family ATPase
MPPSGTAWPLGLGWAGGAATWALLGRLAEHRTAPAGLCDRLLWAYLVAGGPPATGGAAGPGRTSGAAATAATAEDTANAAAARAAAGAAATAAVAAGAAATAAVAAGSAAAAATAAAAALAPGTAAGRAAAAPAAAATAAATAAASQAVILGKDGSLLAGWSYRGPDASAATAADLDALSAQVSRALLPLGDGWMLHWDAIRRPAPGYAPAGAFPDPVTALLDEERRRAYQATAAHFETDTYLTLTHLPPPDLYSRLARRFVQGDAAGQASWNDVLAAFRRAAGDLERRLGAALRLRRLDADDLLTLLHTCLTGLDHPVKAPAPATELDSFLADQQVLGGWRPRIGRLALRAVAIQGFPAASHLGMLARLASVPFALRLSHRVIPLDAATAARLIRRHQLRWFMKRRGAADLVRGAVARHRQPATAEQEADARLFHDHDAARMAADAAAAAAENASGQLRFCLHTPAILLMQPTDAAADHAADEVVKLLADRGFTARVEDVNALEAWLGSLPGHGFPNLRRPLLHSRNVADLLPLTSVWPGLRANPSPYFPPASPPLLWAATSGSTPLRLNLHASDVGHCLVAGPTGAGKSTLVNLVVAQFFRYPGAQVFVFDLGYSGWLLAKAAGASHFAIRPGGSIGSAGSRPGAADEATALQPLAAVDAPGELAAAAEWLELLLTLQGGVPIGPAARADLVAALRQLAAEPRRHRTLSNFCVQLQSLELKDALAPYCRGGALGRLLDADRDDLDRAPYQVFELSHLWELGPKTVAPVLRHLFHRVENRLDGRPTLIVVEEAWRTLLDPAFGLQLKQWLLTLRKKNAAVMVVTQTLADLGQSPYHAAIVESCPTQFLLPSPLAATAGTADLYRALGLNEAELDLLAAARPKRDYYLRSPHGSRLFDLGLGPVALAFLAAGEGMTPQETIDRATDLQRQHGPTWPAAWLADRGLAGWIPVYERFKTQAAQAPAPATAKPKEETR